MRLRLCSLVAITAVLAAMLPATATAKQTRPATRPRQAAVTYAADAFEPLDNTPGGATPVDLLFAPVGGELGLQQHSISDAPTSTADHFDQDWFKFKVEPSDIASGTSYLIEADFRATPRSFLLIEVYGPGIGAVHSTLTSPPVEGTDFADPLTGCIAPDYHLGLGDVWHDDGGVGAVTFLPPSAGEYFFRVRPWRNPADFPSANFGAMAGPYTLRLKKGFMSRAWGAGRVQTAVRFSEELYPTGILTEGGSDAFGDAVVVANGWNYPDALAGSALAGALNAPLLLTNPVSLPASVSIEIERLKPQKVFVLGGPAAVSPAVFAALQALPAGAHAAVTRIAGAGRVETAAKIAQKLYSDAAGNPLKVAFLVNGWSFADALSASPMASLNNVPVLLTHPTSLDAATIDAIERFGITDVVIVGSPAAVSSAVETQLASVLHDTSRSHIRRVQGVNRYDTSREFAAWAAGLRETTGTADGGFRVGTVADPDLMQVLNATTIGVASGADFPDALSGGVWCGHAFAPLLLTPPHEVSPYIYSPSHVTPVGTDDYWFDMVNSGYTRGFERCYLFGGPAAIDDPTLRRLDSVTGAGGSVGVSW